MIEPKSEFQKNVGEPILRGEKRDDSLICVLGLSYGGHRSNTLFKDKVCVFPTQAHQVLVRLCIDDNIRLSVLVNLYFFPS